MSNLPNLNTNDRSDKLNEGFRTLTNIINQNSSKVNEFKQNNQKFHGQLIEKINNINQMLQKIRPNIDNISITQQQTIGLQEELNKTKKQLQQQQEELAKTQQIISELRQKTASLEKELGESKNSKSNNDKQLEDLRKKLTDEETKQYGIITKIAEVNQLLTNLVNNMNDTLDQSRGYNSDYDKQVTSIMKQIEQVVNILNGKSPPSNRQPDVFNPMINNDNQPSTGGKMKKRKNKYRSKRNKKGGWTYDNISMNSSIAASSSTRKRNKSKKPKSSRSSRSSR
jgi:DNA repair exonuclease SbcCD ATPase subunit